MQSTLDCALLLVAEKAVASLHEASAAEVETARTYFCRSTKPTRAARVSGVRARRTYGRRRRTMLPALARRHCAD